MVVLVLYSVFNNKLNASSSTLYPVHCSHSPRSLYSYSIQNHQMTSTKPRLMGFSLLYNKGWRLRWNWVGFFTWITGYFNTISEILCIILQRYTYMFTYEAQIRDTIPIRQYEKIFKISDMIQLRYVI
jgi:hypothetical protein